MQFLNENESQQLSEQKRELKSMQFCDPIFFLIHLSHHRHQYWYWQRLLPIFFHSLFSFLSIYIRIQPSSSYFWFKSYYFLWTDTFLWSTTTERWCDVIWRIFSIIFFFFFSFFTFLRHCPLCVNIAFFLIAFCSLKKRGKDFLSANFLSEIFATKINYIRICGWEYKNNLLGL